MARRAGAGLTQLATRYSSTWATVDAVIPGLPSEYPPLFPWLVGRTSVLIDVPAWRLVGQFEVITMGLAILVGFPMWRRLVPAWVALIAVVFGYLFNPDAAKAYEVIALTVFIPWVLATFGRPRAAGCTAGGRHPAGVHRGLARARSRSKPAWGRYQEL